VVTLFQSLVLERAMENQFVCYIAPGPAVGGLPALKDYGDRPVAHHEFPSPVLRVEEVPGPRHGSLASIIASRQAQTQAAGSSRRAVTSVPPCRIVLLRPLDHFHDLRQPTGPDPSADVDERIVVR
jgi:hypothetical protein